MQKWIVLNIEQSDISAEVASSESAVNCVRKYTSRYDRVRGKDTHFEDKLPGFESC